MALRLPAPPEPPGHGPPAGPGPVVVFLPAHDEEATVAAVVARMPELVAGRRVECLVVDDGSGDRTAELAAAAGATVLSVAGNRGLGAAVRLGLTAAVERGAAAVAFCDADCEYDPAELERLVAPILEGRADYVVGSRFAGEIRRMLPQRRLGNLALTGLLRFVARSPSATARAASGRCRGRPRPTPRSSTTTTTPRSSPSISWPSATATWRSRSATASAPRAGRSSALGATCARSSQRSGASSTGTTARQPARLTGTRAPSTWPLAPPTRIRVSPTRSRVGSPGGGA
jgi:Glycosyl transferase family 2